MIRVADVYQAIDTIAPFGTQEKWDNSGLLVGNRNAECKGIVLTLDITKESIALAKARGCNVMVSHHPVIFSPLRAIDAKSIVYALVRNDITAICTHTPLDMAQGGINDLLVDRLAHTLGLCEGIDYKIHPIANEPIGRWVNFRNPISCQSLAMAAQTALSVPSVRYCEGQNPIQDLAICSGAGASLLEAVSGQCHGLLTGDVKHDRWIKARELGIALLDCGHYYTEVICVEYLAKVLAMQFPEIRIDTYTKEPYHELVGGDCYGI